MFKTHSKKLLVSENVLQKIADLSENLVFSVRFLLLFSSSLLVKVSRTIRKGRRRNHFGIIADILASAVDGALKTHLMFEARLSYAQVENYTSSLVKLKLLRITKRGKTVIYETTEKGKSFLERYRKLNKLLKSR